MGTASPRSAVARPKRVTDPTVRSRREHSVVACAATATTDGLCTPGALTLAYITRLTLG